MPNARTQMVVWGFALAAGGCPFRSSTPTTALELSAAAADGPCMERPRRLALKPGISADLPGARAAFDRGRALADALEWFGAEEAYGEALLLHPSFGLAHLGLADALAYTGGSAEIRRQHLASALVDLPRNPRAHVAFADALDATGDPEGALRHLDCALELKPSLREARRRAVRAALELEDIRAAERLAEPLITEAPEVGDWLVVAELRQAQGQAAAAAAAVEQAAQTSTSAALYRRSAALWSEAGDEMKAEAARARADEIVPPDRRKLRALPKARSKKKRRRRRRAE